MNNKLQIPTPAPADRPTFKIMVGGSQISGEYQVQGVVVSRSFNRVASAELLILDGDPASQDFKASNAGEFKPGGEIEIMAGYHGDDSSIFKGIIIRHGIRVYMNKPAVLRIECKDKAVKMTVGRKSAYYYEMKDSEIIEELAGNAGLKGAVEATDVSYPQMVQFYVSDWDFILTRAEASGKLVITQDGELIVSKPDPTGNPVLSLVYGGNMLEFEAVADAREQYSAVQSFAWDAANQEMLEIDTSKPLVVAPGNLDHGELASIVGLDALQLKHSGQLRDDELQAWADGEWMRSGYAKIRGRIRIQGVAKIKPGDMVELEGVGDRFNGTALVSGIRHEINSKNWETDVTIGLNPEAFGRSKEDVVEAKANGLLPGLSGLQIGLVTSLEDPDGENRIQVRIPMIDPSEEGIWSRVATLDAGENRGSFFLPQPGDEVLLGFLNDDPRNPVVLGMMNSSVKPAPLSASDDNHEKGFVTRSGMKLVFNDEVKAVTIETPNGNKVQLSEKDGGIELVDENGNTLLMSVDGITLGSTTDISIKAAGEVNIEATNVNIKASAQYKAEGSSGAELLSGGSTVVKGSVVQIN